MITTVTLNPSVDKLYILDHFDLNTVARVKEVKNTAGGKGLNVSKVVALLGEDVTATGFLGGFNGKYVVSMLKESHIHADFIEVAGETRSCINVRDLSNGMHTELLEPGETINRENVLAFLTHFKQLILKSKVVTLSGSMPKGAPEDLYNQLIRMAKAQGCKVILDTSGTTLAKAMAEGPTMVKPNQEEIGQIFDLPDLTLPSLKKAIGLLLQKGIETVAVSLGSEGVLVGTNQGIWQGRPPKVKAVNTVGCGDSMVGAFAVAMARALPIEKATAFAVGVSAASAVSMGTGNFAQEDLKTILPQVRVDRV